MEHSTVSSLTTSESNVSVDTLSDIAEFYFENPGMVIFMMLFLFLNSCLAILGNSSVIYLILTRLSLRNSGNIFVANLAITDIMFGAMEAVMFQRTVNKYRDPQNAEFSPVPVWICKLEGVVVSCMLIASIYNMAAIAVNRYVRVCRNDKYGRLCSRMIVIVVAVAIWPLCVLVTIPPLFIRDGMIYSHVFAICSFDQDNNIFQQALLACVGVGIPSSIIVQSYWLIYKKVKESKTKVQTHGGVEANSFQNNVSQQVLSRFLAFCFFMLLFVPSSCLGMVNKFVRLPLMWSMYTGNIVCVSSSINPILYGLFNSHFKKEYIKLAKKFTFKRNNTVHGQVSITPRHTNSNTRQSHV